MRGNNSNLPSSINSKEKQERYLDTIIEKYSELEHECEAILQGGGNDHNRYHELKQMINDAKLSRLQLQKQRLDDLVNIKEVDDEV